MKIEEYVFIINLISSVNEKLCSDLLLKISSVIIGNNIVNMVLIEWLSVWWIFVFMIFFRFFILCICFFCLYNLWFLLNVIIELLIE